MKFQVYCITQLFAALFWSVQYVQFTLHRKCFVIDVLLVCLYAGLGGESDGAVEGCGRHV